MNNKGDVRLKWLVYTLLIAVLATVVYGATSDTHGVQITVGNQDPFIVNVTPHANIDLVEDSSVTEYIIFLAEDGDGNNGVGTALDDSTAVITLTKGGETDIQSTSCTPTDIGTNQTSYNCSIDFWYFYDDGTWAINATICDLAGSCAENTTETVDINLLSAYQGGPDNITFPTVNQGQTNVASNNDPFVMNNTGNADFSVVNVTALNLLGETTPTDKIFAENMSINVADASEGDVLANNTAVTITSALLNRGNHTVDDGSTGQEWLYYYIEDVPTGISAQQYSSAGLGTWTVEVFV